MPLTNGTLSLRAEAWLTAQGCSSTQMSRDVVMPGVIEGRISISRQFSDKHVYCGVSRACAQGTQSLHHDYKSESLQFDVSITEHAR